MTSEGKLWVKLDDWEQMQTDVRRYRHGYGDAMEQAARAYDACGQLARELLHAERRELKLREQLKALLGTVDDALEDDVSRETEAGPDSGTQRYINRLKTDRGRAIEILQDIVPHVGPEARLIVERFLKNMDGT